MKMDKNINVTSTVCDESGVFICSGPSDFLNWVLKMEGVLVALVFGNYIIL